MSHPHGRTLVVHAGGIGDFLLMCPVLPHLARHGPVDLLGRPDRMALAVEAGLAPQAFDIDAAGFESAFSEPSDRLRALIANYKRAIIWMRDDGAIEAAFRKCGVTDVRVFPGLPPENWTEHASRYYLDCLGMADEPGFRLNTAPSQTKYDVVIHPGSGGRKKNWPLERFTELAEGLRERGRTVTWCLGPAEEEIRLLPEHSILRSETLVELARALAATERYIGNDSGVTHLAASAGRPTTAIFGPTDPSVWAPRGPHVRIVQGNPWPEVAEVLATV